VKTLLPALATPLAASLSFVALSAPALSQQTAIFPSAVAGTSGSTYETRFPWANGVSRMMAVYDNWDLTVPNGSTITAIGFRQELGRTSPATGVQLEVYMGPAATDSTSASSTFDNNYQSGVTPTLVFPRAIVNLPAGDSSATTPLDVMIPLTTPYVYDASQGLVVEFRVYANSNANQAFTYFVDRSTYISATSTFGQGCPSSAGTTPSMTFSSSYIGGNLRANLSQAPASSFVYLNLNTVQSQPLLGGPFGAPGCTLYVPPVLVETQQAGSTSGSATFNIPIPFDPSYYGLEVFGQCLIADLFANNLGFVASNAAQIRIGARGPMTTITSQGSATTTAGSVSRYRGVVTLFDYQ